MLSGAFVAECLVETRGARETRTTPSGTKQHATRLQGTVTPRTSLFFWTPSAAAFTNDVA